MIFFVTNQLNISKFLPPQIRKTLFFLLIETELHKFTIASMPKGQLISKANSHVLF